MDTWIYIWIDREGYMDEWTHRLINWPIHWQLRQKKKECVRERWA